MIISRATHPWRWAPPQLIKPVRRTAAACLLATLVALALPAYAHEGSGTLTIELANPVGESVHYVAKLVWEDGHAADDATVTVVAEGPGPTVGPISMKQAGEGLYEAVVRFPEPGVWQVRFTSVSPTTTLTYSQEVAAADPGTTTVATTPAAPAPDAPARPEGTATAPGSQQTTTEPSSTIWIVLGLVLAGAIVAGSIALRRSRHITTPNGSAD